MQINYNTPVCSQCGCNEVKQGHKKYSVDNRWVSRKEILENPNIKLASTYPALWVSDETDIKCTNCNHQFSENEIYKLPKLGPINFIEEEIGMAIYNPKCIKK